MKVTVVPVPHHGVEHIKVWSYSTPYTKYCFPWSVITELEKIPTLHTDEIHDTRDDIRIPNTYCTFWVRLFTFENGWIHSNHGGSSSVRTIYPAWKKKKWGRERTRENKEERNSRDVSSNSVAGCWSVSIILPYPCSIPHCLLDLRHFRLFPMVKGVFCAGSRPLNNFIRTKQMR